MANRKEVEDDKRAVRYKEKEIRQKRKIERERESKWDGNLKREKPGVKLMELLITSSFSSQTKPSTADVWLGQLLSMTTDILIMGVET